MGHVDFDIDLAKTQTFAAAFNATDSDLTALSRRGDYPLSGMGRRDINRAIVNRVEKGVASTG